MKYEQEFLYWYKRYIIEGKKFKNEHYRETFLSMTQQKNDDFLQGKIVADFGCGPRGSLAWTNRPLLKLGIDVLVPSYLNAFKESLLSHDTVYIASTEKAIPIPNEFVDVLFTLNSMDHVENFETMASEILRILKKGALFSGSFNLNEPPTETEPLVLDEGLIRKNILKYLNVCSYRLAEKRPTPHAYDNLLQNKLSKFCKPGIPYVLWVTGIKK